jgi:hypothetical protein
VREMAAVGDGRVAIDFKGCERGGDIRRKAARGDEGGGGWRSRWRCGAGESTRMCGGAEIIGGGEVVLESSGRCAEARMGMMVNGLA